MKIKVSLIFTFLFIINSILCAYKKIEKEEFYIQQKSVLKGLEYYNEVIDNLEKVLDYYVYIELAKNPPQPFFDNSYYPKVDTYKRLEVIRSSLTNETNYYDFFRDIRKLIDNYRDAHMSYGLRGFPFNFAFLCPLKLTTFIDENGNKYMTGEIAFNNEEYFANGTEIFEIIEKNKDNPIKTINGQTPFDFIQNFGGDFFNLKNKQANYAFKTHNYMAPYAIYFPFDENEIGFKVEYENGISFETEYAIVEISNNDNIKDINNWNYFYNDKEIENEFMKFWNYQIDNNNGYVKSINEILDDFERNKGFVKQNNLMNKIEFNKDNILSEKESPNMKWDYEYISGGSPTFQCRVDTENLLNVIHMPTFDFQNVTLIREILKDCVQLFDTNTYQIVVILDFNGGGVELVAQTLVEYIQPYITSNFYSTLRQGEYLDKYYNIDNNFEDFSIVDTCEVPDKKYVLENSLIIDYGEDVILNLTLPLRRLGQYRDEFNAVKESLKNKKKPTEILVFTDGYSASSASLFSKSLQNNGGAILVGYNGNPVSDYVFESSQHFSSVFNRDALIKLDEELYNKMYNTGIYFTQICRTSNFFDYNNPKVPEEYNIKEVDEVVDIYEAYNEEKNYKVFMEKAKNIFEKYETKCNTKNYRLTKLDNSCTFEDQYAHGGHPCNDEGNWDESLCVKVYCDKGYVLDYNKNQCIEDPCAKTDIPTDDETDDTTDDQKDDTSDYSSDDQSDTTKTDTTFGSRINLNKMMSIIGLLILVFN